MIETKKKLRGNTGIIALTNQLRKYEGAMNP